MTDVRRRNVVLVDPAGSEIPAVLECWERNDARPEEVKITLAMQDDQIHGTSSRGFFFALQSIRRELEKKGLLIFCNGAARNVYPSPMIEAMGSGEKAYRNELDKPALMANLVDIFDRDPELPPAAVDDQEAFHRAWINSFLSKQAS